MDGRPSSAWCRGRPPRLGEQGGDSAEASGGGGAGAAGGGCGAALCGPCRTSWPRMARCTNRPTSGEAQYAKWLLMAPSQGFSVAPVCSTKSSRPAAGRSGWHRPSVSRLHEAEHRSAAHSSPQQHRPSKWLPERGPMTACALLARGVSP